MKRDGGSVGESLLGRPEAWKWKRTKQKAKCFLLFLMFHKQRVQPWDRHGGRNTKKQKKMAEMRWETQREWDRERRAVASLGVVFASECIHEVNPQSLLLWLVGHSLHTPVGERETQSVTHQRRSWEEIQWRVGMGIENRFAVGRFFGIVRLLA